MKQTPESDESLEINALVQQCLEGEFNRSRDASGRIQSDSDYVARRLSTVIDDPALIATLVESLLREEIGKNYIEDQGLEVGDRQFLPITPEFEGKNIFKHPDAKSALVSILSQTEGGIIDELLDRGEIDKTEIEEIADELVDENQKSINPQAALRLEKRAGKAGDYAKQWRQVIESFIRTAPDRDYDAEYLQRAHGRWLEGVVTNRDLTNHFKDMVDFTADPKTIWLLVSEIIKTNSFSHKRPTLEELRAVLLRLRKKEGENNSTNTVFWLKTVEEMIGRTR